MQPGASAGDGVSVKKTRGEMGGGVLPNEERFRKKREEDVRVDEVFFHRYFSQKHNKSRTRKEGEGESDAGGEEEPEEEGSEAESVPASDVASVEQEGDEESDLEEDAVWKVNDPLFYHPSSTFFCQAMRATMPKAGSDDELLFESDGEDDDELVPEEDSDKADEESEKDDADSHDDAFSLAEGSDDDDLLAIGEVPGLIEYDGSDLSADEDGDEGEEWGGFDDGIDKRKRKGRDQDEKKRKKRKTLPTFASYEDYAKMIETGLEDDI